MIQTINGAIAANRFGLGARPGDLERIGSHGREWLSRQLGDPNAFLISAQGLPDTLAAGAAVGSYMQAIRQRRSQSPTSNPMPAPGQMPQGAGPLAPLRQIALREGVARFNHALTTQAPFAERLAGFWANHFTVSATKALTIALVGVYERDAIRAHLGGSFANLLLAVARHPGMLLYLDQAQSVGPNSPLGQRRDSGLNENLARELLELHTLGAQGGYTQADVTQLAMALTGWTIAGPRTQRFAPGAAPGSFVFVPAMHEPGPRIVLGKRYSDGGAEQAQTIIADLARHPSTARHVATQLARHFISDAPPESAIKQLEKVFRDTNGDLPSLHGALIPLPHAWDPIPQKYKSPHDFVLSALRLVGAPDIEPKALVGVFDLLGQPLFRAPSPEGWPDDSASWLSPDGIMKRLEWSQALAGRAIGQRRPDALLKEALGELVSASTLESVRRAESGEQGLTLALMSPEFQRR